MPHVNHDSKTKVFHFKQFDVVNEISAMKVNTDGVLLGAWALPVRHRCVWDIGTGTGVIAIMMAQRFPEATVHAVEIDPLSAKEATCNFLSSPWSERLFLHEGDFRQISSSLPAPDLIVCNPPYFDGHKHNLVSPLARKATARHEASLSCSTILEEASRRLNDDGRLCLISPANRENDIQWDAAGSRMYVERKTYVISRVGKAPSRILWRFSKTACSPEVDNLAIRYADNGFTTDYSQLLSPFYINID